MILFVINIKAWLHGYTSILSYNINSLPVTKAVVTRGYTGYTLVTSTQKARASALAFHYKTPYFTGFSASTP
jgi:hypothetical protein